MATNSESVSKQDVVNDVLEILVESEDSIMATNCEEVISKQDVVNDVLESEDPIDSLVDSIGLDKLPDSLKQLIDFNNLKQVVKNAKSFSILLTGRSGTGKSTLVNGILGVELAKEGGSLNSACTTEVTEHTTTKGKVGVTVWDSPGLQDGTVNQDDYLADMKAKCTNRDLTIYCINITQARFISSDENPDVVAMKKLTEAFGPDFWRNTVIALTFANTLESLNPMWTILSSEKKAEAFNKKIKKWEEQIKKIISQEIKVCDEIASNIKVVPVGHYLLKDLPGINYWLSNFWFVCLSAIPSPEAQVALLKLNASRFMRKDQVIPAYFRKKAEEQPIVLDIQHIDKKMLGILGVTTATGAAVGVGIGTLGLIGGPIGAVTIPMGLIVGALFGVLWEQL